MAAFFLGRRHQENITSINSPHSYCCEKCCAVVNDNILKCDCGEEHKIFDWYWNKDHGVSNTSVSSNGTEVVFHPIYSSGNAAIRGAERLQKNVHYYWEIKILTCLYGTDVMVGVGTSKVDFDTWKTRFCSMLGFDNQSWGYSFHGVIQHDNLKRSYGRKFGLGSLIGVHVDMCNGTLEYYLNRRPMGIAFRGLKNEELYPIVSSTAAQSSIKLTCSIVLRPTLQLKILKIINNDRSLMKMYESVPGLTKLFEKGYFWLIPQKRRESDTTPNLELEDEAVLSIPKNHKRVRLSINNINALEIPRKRRITFDGSDPFYCGEIFLQLIDNIENIREDINLKNRNISLESKKGEASRKNTTMPEASRLYSETSSDEIAETSRTRSEINAASLNINLNQCSPIRTYSHCDISSEADVSFNQDFLTDKLDEGIDLYSDLTDGFDFLI